MVRSRSDHGLGRSGGRPGINHPEEILTVAALYGVLVALAILMPLPTKRCDENGTTLLAFWTPWTVWHLVGFYVIGMLWRASSIQPIDDTNVGVGLFAIPSLATLLCFLSQLPAWVLTAYWNHEGLRDGSGRTTRKVFDVYGHWVGRALLLVASALGLWRGLTDVH